jgi:hypothetical protein
MYTAQRLDLKDADGTPLSPDLSLLTQGAGSVNAAGAVELATRINASKGSGASWLTGTPSGQTTLSGYAFSWSSQVLYRDTVLWG